MTERIENLLDAAAEPPSTPSIIDHDGIVRAGRSRARRNRLGVIGGSTGAVAAIAAIALLLPAMTSAAPPLVNEATGPDVETGDAVEQPYFPYPEFEPDPNLSYEWRWVDEGTTTDATAAYSESLVDWIERFDVDITPANDELPDLPDDRLLSLYRAERQLVGYDGNADDTPIGAPVPHYGAKFDVKPTDHELRVEIVIEIWANGSYEPGEGATVPYLYSCQDRDPGPAAFQAGAKRTCGEKVTNDGESVVDLTELVYGDFDGEPYSLMDKAVILYRSDGVAIQISQISPGAEDDDGAPIDTSYFTTEELTALATSMPEAIVE
ncbi:hypothetical protein [Stackebrandtia soli]|uniref:hypothetical protein n=1 Tax=Stackebrandtia soli TaxID=1892856 RepID=UPI0039E772D6